MRNSTDGRNPKGFLTLGNLRPFRQELLGKQQSCFVAAAALRSLASSRKEKCWIDPASLAKAGNPGLHVVHPVQPARVIWQHECAAAGRQQPKGGPEPAVTGSDSQKEPETGVIRLFQEYREGAGLNPVSPVNTGL